MIICYFFLIFFKLLARNSLSLVFEHSQLAEQIQHHPDVLAEMIVISSLEQKITNLTDVVDQQTRLITQLREQDAIRRAANANANAAAPEANGDGVSLDFAPSSIRLKSVQEHNFKLTEQLANALTQLHDNDQTIAVADETIELLENERKDLTDKLAVSQEALEAAEDQIRRAISRGQIESGVIDSKVLQKMAFLERLLVEEKAKSQKLEEYKQTVANLKVFFRKGVGSRIRGEEKVQGAGRAAGGEEENGGLGENAAQKDRGRVATCARNWR